MTVLPAACGGTTVAVAPLVVSAASPGTPSYPTNVAPEIHAACG